MNELQKIWLFKHENGKYKGYIEEWKKDKEKIYRTIKGDETKFIYDISLFETKKEAKKYMLECCFINKQYLIYKAK